MNDPSDRAEWFWRGAAFGVVVAAVLIFGVMAALLAAWGG